MTKSKLRTIEHIAVASAGDDLFATATAETNVSLWSFQNRKKISELSTILDFGGSRLALVFNSGPQILTGSWRRGLVAYDGTSGIVRWSRRDLKNIQQVRDISNGTRLLIGVGLEGRPYHVLEAMSGENYLQFTRIRKVFASRFAPLYLLVSQDAVHLSTLQSPSIWQKPLVSFAVLDAAFSPDHVTYSESAGRVYCFDLYGTEIWRFTPEFNHHILHIVWNTNLGTWLAVDWDTHGGPKRLIEINNSGEHRFLGNIDDCWQVEFLASGEHLVTSSGRVISAHSGEIVWEFAHCP